MKYFTAIAMIAFAVITDAFGPQHRHDEKDDMPLRQRRLSNDILGHAGAATDAVAPGHAGHPFSGSVETRLGVMERVNSWLELHPDEEGQGEQQAPQGSSLRRLDRKNRYKVDVRFVQIKPNSTVPTIPTRSYRDSIRQVNRDYRGSGFTFRFVEAVAVVDPEHFGCSFYDETDFAVGQVYRQGNATMLNVLLCDTPEGVGGFSYQPFYLPSGGDFEKAVDAVFLREKQLNAVGFLTHEIGHWLGLDHTDWNDCDFPGDGVDDTPYQAGTENQDCAAVLDTCPDKPGLDQMNNFMGYTKTCGNSFTPGQQARMRAVYENFRLNLDDTDACEFELEVTFDDKPEQVKIFVETNDWYDYLIVRGKKYAPNGTYTLSSYFVEGEGSLSIQDAGGDGMGAGTNVTLTLLDGNGGRHTLASVAGRSMSTDVQQELLIVNFTVPSGCSFAPTPAPAPSTCDADSFLRECKTTSGCKRLYPTAYDCKNSKGGICYCGAGDPGEICGCL